MKNPKVVVAVCAGVLLLSACGEKNKSKTVNAIPEISGKVTYSDTSVSSVKVFDQNGRICVQQSNTYYELADFYKGEQKTSLLLKVRKTELCVADSVNKHKVFEIEANNIGAGNIHWNLQFAATEFSISDNTLRAVHEGVNSEEDFVRRFSLQNGEEIFSCSYSELKVAIPNIKDKRFIGYTSKTAASEPLKEFGEENLLAVIQYASSEKNYGKYKLKLKRSRAAAKIAAYTPEMSFVSTNESTSVIEEGKSIIMMKADEHYKPEDIKDFSVQFTFYFGEDNETTVVSIPVVNDRLNISTAKYDKEIFELEQ